ncbi:hypothetical protein N7537_002997 [Penicillium hordei]|uniref:Uncharacterized protein n=1 Tax=Penicillium hordei TaxID=40994 RepID=A0AAD6EID5_9EURO|nr:uncharacterized protein N7537_002997 [Penicillium hordei]KAJ5617883.1 hypothetical protein N7537_002997 [Penicillium hordei]
MTATVISPTKEVPNMTPDYEVKLLLNPTAVLSSKHELTDTVLSTFNTAPTIAKINVQFLDTCSKDIYTAGWGGGKRYAITGGDIDAALTTGNSDGFDAGDTKYKAQVEWGYEKQTLSISRKKDIAKSRNSGTDLPGTSESRKMLIDEAPDKFDNWYHNKWGTKALAMSRIFGPVVVRRSVGMWNGMELYLEVWPLLNFPGTEIEHIVEASFKTKSRTTASVEQNSLANYLQSRGWLLAQDSLKTQLIMERY